MVLQPYYQFTPDQVTTFLTFWSPARIISYVSIPPFLISNCLCLKLFWFHIYWIRAFIKFVYSNLSKTIRISDKLFKNSMLFYTMKRWSISINDFYNIAKNLIFCRKYINRQKWWSSFWSSSFLLSFCLNWSNDLECSWNRSWNNGNYAFF